MKKLRLYLKLGLIFAASLLMPNSVITSKVEKLLAELEALNLQDQEPAGATAENQQDRQPH